MLHIHEKLTRYKKKQIRATCEPNHENQWEKLYTHTHTVNGKMGDDIVTTKTTTTRTKWIWILLTQNS